MKLLDLILTIAIIGILANLSLSTYNKFYKPKIATAHMKTIVAHIEKLRQIEDKTTMEITGAACNDCLCRYGSWQTPQCINQMYETYRKLGYNSPPKTPWGGWYYLDNNEGEPFWHTNWGDKCYADTISYYDRDNDRVVSIAITPHRCTGAFDVFGGGVVNPDGTFPNYSVPTTMYREVLP